LTELRFYIQPDTK